MRNKHLTKHDTNDDVDLDNCGVHVERTLSHLMSSHTSLAQVLSMGLETACGAMTKLIERNTTFSHEEVTDVHDGC